MLNSPQRRWDCKRVCSNTRGVNCTVCWAYGDIWTINMYIYIYIYKKPVTTMLTYPWKCTVLHCNHLGNTWKPLVLMTWHFDYCLSASEGDNQSVKSSAPAVSRCFPGGYNVKLYIYRGRLAWWLLAFLHSVWQLWVVWIWVMSLAQWYFSNATITAPWVWLYKQG